MLAVAGGKGGVGKTTTALGVARELAGRRRRPVVVDADRDMPDLHVLADVPAAPGVAAVAEGAPPERGVHEAGRWPDVAVCPATPGARAGPALDRLDDGARTVLVDCPGGAGPDAVDPLRRADRAVVVTTPAAPAVEDAVKTAEVARAVGTPVAGAAVTRTETTPEGLADALGAPVAVGVPAAQAPLDADAVRAAYARLATALDGPNG